MRAVWYDRQGPAREVLQHGELPTPKPGEGEALVRLHASGVNPSDCNGRAGRFGRKMLFPRIVPNSDGAGVVEAVGPGADRALVGQRVWLHNGQRGRAFGTAAEYIALDARLLCLLPSDVPYEVGAGLGIPGMTAHVALFRDGPVEGKTVLVTGGAGAVGYYAVQLAKQGGARVIATVSSPEKAEHARTAGADLVLNYRTDPLAGAIADYTNGAGVDRVVEVDFGANLPVSLQVLANNGTIAMYSSVGNLEPTVPALGLMFKGATVHFVQLSIAPLPLRQAAQGGITAWLRSDAAVHRVLQFPLARIAEAHEAVESGKRIGTVAVTI